MQMKWAIWREDIKPVCEAAGLTERWEKQWQLYATSTPQLVKTYHSSSLCGSPGWVYSDGSNRPTAQNNPVKDLSIIWLNKRIQCCSTNLPALPTILIKIDQAKAHTEIIPHKKRLLQSCIQNQLCRLFVQTAEFQYVHWKVTVRWEGNLVKLIVESRIYL